MQYLVILCIIVSYCVEHLWLSHVSSNSQRQVPSLTCGMNVCSFGLLLPVNCAACLHLGLFNVPQVNELTLHCFSEIWKQNVKARTILNTTQLFRCDIKNSCKVNRACGREIAGNIAHVPYAINAKWQSNQVNCDVLFSTRRFWHSCGFFGYLVHLFCQSHVYVSLLIKFLLTSRIFVVPYTQNKNINNVACCVLAVPCRFSVEKRHS